jgi:SAM-dependent methyltransferase
MYGFMHQTQTPRAERRTKWEAFWRQPRATHIVTHQVSADLALELLRTEDYPDRSLRVLDLGCGAGGMMQLLADAGCEVFGLDIASGALGTARQRLGPAPPLVQGDAFQLGLASDSFDVVISLGYASVGSYPGVQAELARVLRLGGIVLADFRRLGLYHLPVVPWRLPAWVRAWRRGEVSVPILGLQPAPSWSKAGLQLEQARLFNSHPPFGSWLRPDTLLAFERILGGRCAAALARTALAKFRKTEASPVRRRRTANG